MIPLCKHPRPVVPGSWAQLRRPCSQPPLRGFRLALGCKSLHCCTGCNPMTPSLSPKRDKNNPQLRLLNASFFFFKKKKNLKLERPFSPSSSSLSIFVTGTGRVCCLTPRASTSTLLLLGPFYSKTVHLTPFLHRLQASARVFLGLLSCEALAKLGSGLSLMWVGAHLPINLNLVEGEAKWPFLGGFFSPFL